MNHNAAIPLKALNESPYADIICYPKLTPEELRKRLKELKKLQISAIEFTGKKTIHNTPILGKGCVGIVVKAETNTQTIALKIRRTDADRKEMTHEAEMLRKANSINVGPKFLDQSKNFLVMEYIHGSLFPEWLTKMEQKQKIRRVLRSALMQCWRMDKTGLDHGELSHAPKHIIIRNQKPCIIDFETASTTRKTQNVTALAQYLFMSRQIARQITKKLGRINQKKLKQALKQYKQQRAKENFQAILEILKL